MSVILNNNLQFFYWIGYWLISTINNQSMNSYRLKSIISIYNWMKSNGYPWLLCFCFTTNIFTIYIISKKRSWKRPCWYAGRSNVSIQRPNWEFHQTVLRFVVQCHYEFTINAELSDVVVSGVHKYSIIYAGYSGHPSVIIFFITPTSPT